MPFTVFDTKGIPVTRRERIEAAVEAGGKHVAAPSEAWIAADPRRVDVRVLLVGPHRFERTVRFAADEAAGTIRGNIASLLLWAHQDGDEGDVDKRLRQCPIH